MPITTQMITAAPTSATVSMADFPVSKQDGHVGEGCRREDGDALGPAAIAMRYHADDQSSQRAMALPISAVVNASLRMARTPAVMLSKTSPLAGNSGRVDLCLEPRRKSSVKIVSFGFSMKM